MTAPGSKNRRPTIKRRLVRNVAVAMLVVLVATSGFVYWRVEHALDRQLNRDLGSYHDVVMKAVESGTDVPSRTSGQSYQVVGSDGEILFGSAKTPARELLTDSDTAKAFRGKTVRADRGSMLPPSRRPFRVRADRVDVSRGPVVVVSAISRHPRDEALRELLLQLGIADVLVLLAASYVGYRTARGALDPVERYRIAAALPGAMAGARLPVEDDRDDELTRLGHTLNDLLDRVETSARRERRFIADASHELRTPLALLKAEVELALHRPRSVEESRASLSSIAQDIDGMIELSNALLDLEELASTGPPGAERVQVSDLVHAVAGRFRPVLEAQGRTIGWVVDEDVSVDVSRRWIEAAVVNLVSNAHRHGAGEVTIYAQASEHDLELVVTDEGAGFATDLTGSAFERFTRGDESRSTPGSGLGLALVRAAAESHGGTAEIRPVAQGASVAIVIPLGPAS